MSLERYRGKSVLILGLGANNRDLAGYLLGHGISVTIRDSLPSVRDAFAASYPQLVEKATWQHMPDILKDLDGFDVLFRSPSIPIHTPALVKARARGAEITSQTRLFMDLCPAITVGVTGTKGKGTTCSLIYRMLREGYSHGRTFLAGNIGVDPFSFLDRLTEKDIVVLELSSFQLEDLEVSPHIAVLLNVTSDHLDHHRSIDDYHKAKLNIILHQEPNDVAIINAEYAVPREAMTHVKGKLYGYTRHTPSRQSAWVETIDGKEVVFVQREGEIESFEIEGRRLLGQHNLENILPAALVGAYFRVSPLIMSKAIIDFAGLEHRLAFVAEHNGVRFIDDSIATTPEACIVAMQAFPESRVHMIVGGKSKGHPNDAVAKALAARATTITFLPGSATPSMRKAIERELKRTKRRTALISSTAEPLMETLLSGIVPHLQSGDTVVLAPGQASDAPYANYKERGDAFVAAIKKRYAQ
jgi:UDP-N-acetylmuramoylalanine--D-glutamate ligase